MKKAEELEEEVQKMKTKQSKLSSDLNISQQETKDCNEDLAAETKKHLQCESGRRSCANKLEDQTEINHVQDDNKTTTMATTSQTTTLEIAPVTTTTTPSIPWSTNSTLSYTVLVLNTRYSRNKPMTVDFNGKNHSDFHFKSIFTFDFKVMLTTI